MIDPQTTWAILADPMTYVVGVLGASNAFAARRWWKCLRGWEATERALNTTRDTVKHNVLEVDNLSAALRNMTGNYHRVCTQLGAADIAHEDVKRNMQMAYLKDVNSANWERDAAISRCTYLEDRAFDLEDRLRKIEQQRHNGAKIARAAQIAQRKAAKDARTAQLRAELEASVAQPMAEAA